jgi:hypothetical protein
VGDSSIMVFRCSERVVAEPSLESRDKPFGLPTRKRVRRSIPFQEESYRFNMVLS